MTEDEARKLVYERVADTLEGLGLGECLPPQLHVTKADRKLAQWAFKSLIARLRLEADGTRYGHFYKFTDSDGDLAQQWGGVIAGEKPKRGELITLVRTDGGRTSVIVVRVIRELARGWAFTFENYDPDPGRWLDDDDYDGAPHDSDDIPF
jgi:hypothetical protein